MWNIFHDRVLALTHDHVPMKTAKRKRKSDWMTSHTLKQIQQRAKAWRKHRLHPTAANYKSYKVIRNKVNRMVKDDQDTYREKILRSFKGNPKRFYGYIRNLQTVKTGVSQLVNRNGSISTNDTEMAEILCDFFKEVFVREDDTEADVEDNTGYAEEEKLADITSAFSRDKIMKKLLSLKPDMADKSAGPDGIHPLLMSECASEISVPLQFIY